MGEMACYTDRCPQCGKPPPGGKPILQAAARPAPQQGYGRPRSPRPHGGGGGGGHRQQQQYYHGEGGGGGGGGYANSNL